MRLERDDGQGRVTRVGCPLVDEEGRDVVRRATIDYMTQPTSLRLTSDLKRRLDDAAGELRASPSALAVQLIDEGLRTLEVPGIVFHDSLAHGRVAAIVGGPDVVEVVDVVGGLEATGDARLHEAAEWLGLHPSQVRAAIRYYAAYQDDVDREVALRRSEAAEERARYDVERSLLG
jgi:hypothetical protein